MNSDEIRRDDLLPRKYQLIITDVTKKGSRSNEKRRPAPVVRAVLRGCLLTNYRETDSTRFPKLDSHS